MHIFSLLRHLLLNLTVLTIAPGVVCISQITFWGRYTVTYFWRAVWHNTIISMTIQCLHTIILYKIQIVTFAVTVPLTLGGGV